VNKFDSTLLPQTNDKEEIQKGNLDLLEKINATILFMQEGIVTFAQEILKVLSTYIFPASRVSFAPGNSGLSATEVQTMGTELANPVNVKASVVDADTVTGNDSADGGKVKKWTWTTIKAFLKTYFDTFYPIYTTGTQVIGISFGGGSVGITYSFAQAEWQKTGKHVHVNGYIILSSKGTSTGAAKITGLPFPVKNSTAGYSPCGIAGLGGITFADFPSGYGLAGASEINLQETTNAGTTTDLTNADFTNTATIMISIDYITA